MLLCAAVNSWALDPGKHIDQYGHDTWTSQNGLPGQAVYQILESPDGYLWLRTSAGLVRFDGVRFVLTEPLVAGRAVTEPVKAICLGTAGDLLVRTTSRTLIYKDGIFSDYRPPAPLPDGDIRGASSKLAGASFCWDPTISFTALRTGRNRSAAGPVGSTPWRRARTERSGSAAPTGYSPIGTAYFRPMRGRTLRRWPGTTTETCGWAR